MQTTVFPVRTMPLPHCQTQIERFDLTSTSELPIAVQRRQVYFDLLHSRFSPITISSQLRADLTRTSRHLPFYITTLVSRCIRHHLGEMDGDRNFYHPDDNYNAGEALMNTQQLEERLADLKEQFREASTTLSSVDASPINQYEVWVALITTDRSLNFPLRTHSQIIPHTIQPGA